MSSLQPDWRGVSTHWCSGRCAAKVFFLPEFFVWLQPALDQCFSDSSIVRYASIHATAVPAPQQGVEWPRWTPGWNKIPWAYSTNRQFCRSWHETVSNPFPNTAVYTGSYVCVATLLAENFRYAEPHDNDMTLPSPNNDPKLEPDSFTFDMEIPGSLDLGEW